jgi:Domain of unknown function (DUF1707)
VHVTGSYTSATDDDRNNICQMLDAALGEGQLSNEEHRQRVASATHAATVGELQSLVSDLQIHSAPGQPPASKAPARRLGMWLALAASAVVAVLVLSGSLLAWALWPNNSSPPKSAPATNTKPSPSAAARTPTTTAPQAPPNLLTLGGLTGLLAQIRTKFGDTMGYQLEVETDSATIERPDAANAHKIVSYFYQAKNGWVDWMSSSSSSPPFDLINGGDTAVGDLSKFDMQATAGVVRAAPQTVHVSNPKNTSVFICSAKNGSLGIHISVFEDMGRSGYMNVAADGTVKRIVTADS